MHTNENASSTCNPHVTTSFYHKRPVWERLSCSTRACRFSVHLHPPTPSLGTTDVKATLNYTVGVVFTSDAKLRRLGMGKRCVCLQGTEGQEDQEIKEVMHGISVPSSLSTVVIVQGTSSREWSSQVKVEVLIILAFVWNHAGKLALSICCTLGIRVIGQMLDIQE